MFGYKIDLTHLGRRMRETMAPHWRTWAGAFFVATALFSIQYDEVLAPTVGKLSQAWSNTALDLGKKLSGFAL